MKENFLVLCDKIKILVSFRVLVAPFYLVHAQFKVGVRTSAYSYVVSHTYKVKLLTPLTHVTDALQYCVLV